MKPQQVPSRMVQNKFHNIKNRVPIEQIHQMRENGQKPLVPKRAMLHGRGASNVVLQNNHILQQLNNSITYPMKKNNSILNGNTIAQGM